MTNWPHPTARRPRQWPFRGILTRPQQSFDAWATISGPYPVRARIAAAGLVLPTALTRRRYPTRTERMGNPWLTRGRGRCQRPSRVDTDRYRGATRLSHARLYKAPTVRGRRCSTRRLPSPPSRLRKKSVGGASSPIRRLLPLRNPLI